MSERYARLSHCWGRDVPLRLTKYTFTMFKRGFPPPDSLRHSRKSSLLSDDFTQKYLSVNALCFFQDSINDWSVQAQDMASVYSNSYLDIAASTARNSHAGLFERHKPDLRQAVGVRCGRGCSYVVYTSRFAYMDLVGALSERAWVVQERFLSSRAVHFGCRGRVHYECLACTTTAVLPMGFFTPRSWADFKTHDSLWETLSGPLTMNAERVIYGLWDKLLRYYTRGQLTFASDKAIDSIESL